MTFFQFYLIVKILKELSSSTFSTPINFERLNFDYFVEIYEQMRIG